MYSASYKGVVLEVRLARGDVVSCIAVHHLTRLCISSIQGSSKIIIDLLNRGSDRYKYVCISCLAARTLLLPFVGSFIPLLFLAVWLYVALFVTVMAGEIGVIPSLFLAI